MSPKQACSRSRAEVSSVDSGLRGLGSCNGCFVALSESDSESVSAVGRSEGLAKAIGDGPRGARTIARFILRLNRDLAQRPVQPADAALQSFDTFTQPHHNPDEFQKQFSRSNRS